jgi:hypothetical protein
MTNAYQPTSDLVHEQVARRCTGCMPAEFRANAGDREIPVMVLEPLNACERIRRTSVAPR